MISQRFKQMKGSETEELAMAFIFIVASTPGSGVTSEFLSIPWQELTMSQIENVGSCAEKNLQLLGFARNMMMPVQLSSMPNCFSYCSDARRNKEDVFFSE